MNTGMGVYENLGNSIVLFKAGLGYARCGEVEQISWCDELNGCCEETALGFP